MKYKSLGGKLKVYLHLFKMFLFLHKYFPSFTLQLFLTGVTPDLQY